MLASILGRTLASKGAVFGEVDRRMGRGAGRSQERQGSRATAVGAGSCVSMGPAAEVLLLRPVSLASDLTRQDLTWKLRWRLVWCPGSGCEGRGALNAQSEAPG